MENYDLTGLSFLIVEKHLPMSSMLRGILRELGVTDVHAASSPETGFEEFNLLVPDMVLVDWSPGFDGIGLLKKIRSDAASVSPYVPVIMVTAHGEAEKVFAARDAGMTEYLTKPISGTRLYQRIASIVKSNRKFVRASKFFGPDRRRRTKEFDGGCRRGAGERVRMASITSSRHQ